MHSAPDLAYATNLCLEELGASALPVPKIEAMIGNGMVKLVERALAASNIEMRNKEFHAVMRKFYSHYEANLTRETALYPGVIEVLTHLKKQGCLLAICTNKKQKPSEEIADALNITHFFDSIIGADDSREHKPSAEPLWLAVKLAGGTPGRAVLVGDSRADAECAEAAGVPGILVDYGYTTTPVSELPSVAVISNIIDVIKVLEDLGLQC